MFFPRSSSGGPSTKSPETDPTICTSTISMAPCAVSREQSPVHSKSNILRVGDLKALKDLLTQFPDEELGDHDLLLNCSEEIVRHPSVAKIVNELRGHRRLVSFDPDREILKVQEHNLHNAIQRVTNHAIMTQLPTVIPSPEHRACLFLGTGERLLGKAVPRLGKKWRGWKKSPDMALFYSSEETMEDLCRIIVETGLTESYEDLADDARQWLNSSHGQVQLVVIVKITEDLAGLNQHKKGPKFQKKVRRLVAKYGNELSAAEHGIQLNRVVVDDEFPTPDFEEEITTSDWFVSITVFMELWELYDGMPRRRPNSRVQVIPVDPTAKEPRITIQDMIPSKYRGEHDLDQDRAVVLPLELYRPQLEKMRVISAVSRAFDKVWPCK